MPTAPDGSEYCFEWGGLLWGKDHPGWLFFKAYLENRGVDTGQWVDEHHDAALCLEVPGVSPLPPPPVQTVTPQPSSLPPLYTIDGPPGQALTAWSLFSERLGVGLPQHLLSVGRYRGAVADQVKRVKGVA